MTPRQKVEKALALLQSALDDETNEPRLQSRPEVEAIQTRDSKPTKKRWVPGWFAESKSGRHATHFTR